MRQAIEFFKTPATLRKWLEKNHDKIDEQWIGFYKVATGKPSITWQESVDEALCFGWIDGLRKTIDDDAYKIRFTPRRPGSVWSAKNIATAEELIAAGRMQPTGLAAFEKRTEDKSRVHSYEQAEKAGLGTDYEKRFKKNKAAWKYFQARPPGYRRTATAWVVSAKKEETRLRRLDQLIECSGQGRPIPPLERKR